MISGTDKESAKMVVHDFYFIIWLFTNLLYLSSAKVDEKVMVGVLENGKVTGIDKHSMNFNPNDKVVMIKNVNMQNFVGHNLDFHGASIENVALINPTIENVRHLNIESLGILSHAAGIGGGTRFIVVNERGNITTASSTRWNNDLREMQVVALSSVSKLRPLEIRSDIDVKSNVIHNAKLGPGSQLNGLTFSNGFIVNSTLQNITASELEAGVIDAKSLKLTSLSQDYGYLLRIGADGKVATSYNIQEENDKTTIYSKLDVRSTVDMNENKLSNVNVVSGTINGTNITVSVNNIRTKSLALADLKLSNETDVASLAVILSDGHIQRSPISLSSSGEVVSMNISGTLSFGDENSTTASKGRIINAIIEGADIRQALSISVEGMAYFSDGIIGAGPYIDASDRRFKKNIKSLSGQIMLEKLELIRGIKYEMAVPHDSKFHKSIENNKKSSAKKSNDRKGTQFGFVAQEVEEIFPELVHTGEDGYKGVQYARFVPILVESVNQLKAELELLAKEVKMLREENIILLNAL